MISANPFARAVAAFVVGGLAVLVVHQPVVALLHALGSTPITPYSLRATRPWGIPVFLSLSFWGGIWAIPIVWVLDRSAARMDLLDRRNQSWRIAANLDDLVRHFSVEESLGQQDRRVSRRCQCADLSTASGVWQSGLHGLGCWPLHRRHSLRSLLPTEFEGETQFDPLICDHCVECHFGKVISPFGFVFEPLSDDLFLGWRTARVNAGGETPWLSATPVKFRASPKAVQRE